MSPDDEMPYDVILSFGPRPAPQMEQRTFHMPLSHLVFLLASATSLARRNGCFSARRAFSTALDHARDEQLSQFRDALNRIVGAELGGGWVGRWILRRRRDRIVEAVMGTIYDDVTLLVDELGDASSRLYDMGRAVTRLQTELTSRHTQKASS